MDSSEDEFSSYDEDYVHRSKATASVALPMISGCLSMIACYIIIRENVADLLTKQRIRYSKAAIDPVIPKQFVSMCVAYLFWYFALALGPIPAPKDEVNNEVMGASGTISTCTAAGFFMQFGAFAAVPLHTCLIWFYMIIVRYNWTHQRLNWYFCWLNGFIWTLSFVVASIPAYLGYYNFTGANCWLASFPRGCDNNIDSKGESGDTCIRGANVKHYKAVVTAFPYVPCWMAFIVLFFMIYKTVRHTENRTLRYATTKAYFSFRFSIRIPKAERQAETKQVAIGTFNLSTGHDPSESMTETSESKHKDNETINSSGKIEHADNCASVEKTQANNNATSSAEKTKSNPKNNPVNRSKSNAVATQAMLLISVIFLAIVLNASARSLRITTGSIPSAFNLFVDVFLSLTGVFNAIVFCRPRGATDMKTPEGRLFRRIFFSCEGCCAYD